MATVQNDNTQSSSLPERLILDSQSREAHPDMASLLQAVEKAQGDTLGKIVTGLRGYTVLGFSFKVYATPIDATGDTTYKLRVDLEYHATVKQGANYERVRSAYLDVSPSSEQTPMEPTRVAKPGK